MRKHVRWLPAGLWQNVATAIETETTLVAQPKATELEYRAIAINLVPENPLSWLRTRGKAGDGPRSNTVVAVLCLASTLSVG